MRPLRVLVIFDNLELNGTHRVALNLMDAGPSAGLVCQGLVCMSDKVGLTDTDARLAWPTRALGRSESLWTKLRKAFTVLRVATGMARQADVLLATCPPSSVIASWAGWRAAKPVVGWVHYDAIGRRRERAGSTGGWLRDALQNLLYFHFVPRLRHLFFVSDATRHSLARSVHWSGPPAGWRTVPNPYRPAGFAPSSRCLTAWQAIRSRREPMLLFLGRLARQKRWEAALAAAEHLHSLGILAQWVFIGDGPERLAFSAAIEASPVRERLHALGADPNPLPLLADADALVLTSLYEAWPTVILEAFDLGVPVVAYDCPSGPADMLGAGQRGWLTAEQPAALAAALAERLDPGRQAEVQRRTAAAQAFLAAFRPEQALPVWRQALGEVVGAWTD